MTSPNMTYDDLTLNDKIAYFIDQDKEGVAESYLTGVYTVDFKKLDHTFLDIADEIINEGLNENIIKCFENEYMIRADKNLFINTEINNVPVRFKNLPITPLHEVLAKDFRKIIETRGTVKSVSEIYLEPDILTFECNSCMKIVKIKQNKEEAIAPLKCMECGGKSFKALPNESVMRDTRLLIIEEASEDTITNQPRRMIVKVNNDKVNDTSIDDNLVYKADTGDNVHIIGKITGSLNKKTEKRRFNIIANNIINQDDHRIQISKKDEKEIIKLSNQENILELLIDSFAHNLILDDKIKLSVLCALVKGTQNREIKEDKEEIHLLIVSDPAMAKSQLGQEAVKISEHGIIADGSQSTGVGLVGAVVKNELTGTMMLEAGAMALANEGLLVIDEFDKLPLEQSKKLLTGMERGIVPINKAGINENLKTKTTIISLANPKNGRFNLIAYPDLISQVNIYPPLMSRYDLIFLLTDDTSNEKNNRRMAEILLKGNQESETLIEEEMLRKYISYVRKKHPTLTKESEEKLENYYVDMFQPNETLDTDGPIGFDKRSFQSLIRISGAIAKLRNHEEVYPIDVEKAIELKEASMKQIGTDPITGRIDIDRVQGTGSSTERHNTHALINCIKNSEMYQELGYIKKTVLKEEFESYTGKGKTIFYKTFNQLIKNHDIIEEKGEIRLSSNLQK